ncbi:MAG: GntR family transcriptional regulator [Burkholderiaceae bacterium]
MEGIRPLKARKAPKSGSPAVATASRSRAGTKRATAHTGESPATVAPASRARAELEFTPVKSRRLFEQICEQIRAEVESGALRPGDKLPAERDLAARFGVSRMAVREALRSLENAGVVALHTGVKGGAFILEGSPDTVRVSIQDMLSLGSISLSSVTEARSMLLENAVRLACARASEEDFDAIDRNIDRLYKLSGETPQAVRLDIAREFYGLVAKAARNEVLEILIDAVTDISMRLFVRLHPELVKGLRPARRRLAKALRARDAETAVKEMREHLQNVHRVLERKYQATRG